MGTSTQIQGQTGVRLALASIFCGPVAGLVVILIIGFFSFLMSLGSGYGFMPVSVIWVGVMFGAVIGWPAMLLFGLPAHALLYRRRSYKIGGYLLAGALLGLLAAILLALLQATTVSGLLGLNFLMTGGFFAVILLLSSVCAASVFWWIRRPDRDVPPPEKLAATFE